MRKNLGLKISILLVVITSLALGSCGNKDYTSDLETLSKSEKLTSNEVDKAISIGTVLYKQAAEAIDNAIKKIKDGKKPDTKVFDKLEKQIMLFENLKFPSIDELNEKQQEKIEKLVEQKEAMQKETIKMATELKDSIEDNIDNIEETLEDAFDDIEDNVEDALEDAFDKLDIDL